MQARRSELRLMLCYATGFDVALFSLAQRSVMYDIITYFESAQPQISVGFLVAG